MKVINFPSEVAFELWKIAKESGKPIYASYCYCGTLSVKSGKKFTKEEKEYCPKCNPKPISFLSKLIGLIALVLIIKIIL